MHTLYAPSPIKSTIKRLQLQLLVVVRLPSNYNNKNTTITGSYFYILIRKHLRYYFIQNNISNNNNQEISCSFIATSSNTNKKIDDRPCLASDSLQIIALI